MNICHQLIAGCDFDEEGVILDVFSALYKQFERGKFSKTASFIGFVVEWSLKAIWELAIR